jgi:hypothetical protein
VRRLSALRLELIELQAQRRQGAASC